MSFQDYEALSKKLHSSVKHGNSLQEKDLEDLASILHAMIKLKGDGGGIVVI